MMQFSINRFLTHISKLSSEEVHLTWFWSQLSKEEEKNLLKKHFPTHSLSQNTIESAKISQLFHQPNKAIGGILQKWMEPQKLSRVLAGLVSFRVQCFAIG